jgi:hypothetical protein
MKADNAERFEGLLAALERELIEATDEEILAAARELGMPPGNEGLCGVLRQRDRFLSAIPAERPAGVVRRAHPPGRLKDDPPH